MQTFRVIDAIDDTIDDLVAAHHRAIEDLDAQLERITKLRAASEAYLLVAGRTVSPTMPINAPKRQPVIDKPETVECSHCGVSMSPHGLKVHIARKHNGRSFDPQAARDAAAAAI